MSEEDDLRGRSLVAEAYYRRSQQIRFLDEAISTLRVLVEGEEVASERGEDLNRLGGLLWERFERVGELTDLDRCIETMRHLLEVTPPASELYPSFLQNLGLALETRFRRILRAEDIDESVLRHREAIELGSRRGQIKLMWANNLANALRLRAHFSDQIADLQEAIQLHESVVAQTPSYSPDYPAHAANLGSDLLDLYSWPSGNRDPSLLETARGLLQMAVSRSAGEPADHARFQALLANALQETALISRPNDEFAESVTASYRAAVLAGKAAHPETAMRSAMNWGNWAFAHRHWQQAAGAFRDALEIAGNLLAQEADRERKQAWLREAQGSGERAAYALTELGRPEEAVMILERSRARILAESLARKAGALPRVGPLPTLEDVAGAAAGGAILYLCSTFHGGVALVVQPGREARVTPCSLPKLTESFLESHLRYYFGAYSIGRGRTEVWLQALDDVTRKLWPAVFEPLASTIESASHAVLIPVGRVALLPLHAAWTENPGQRSGRTYALDRFSLSDAPNAQTLLALSEPELDQATHLLAVADPSLPGAVPEARSISLTFPHSTLLVGEHASRSRVLAELTEHHVLHFASHARANLFEPSRSAVLLPDGSSLQLSELQDIPLGKARLVVLAACETGVQGLGLPDEVLNLPMGFLAMGIPCVVESRWAVEDRSTALLMIHFYHLWRHEGVSPTQALRQAQRWLRDSTREEKLQFVRSSPEGSLDTDDRKSFIHHLAEGSKDQADYSHPFHWAGFHWTGRVSGLR